VGSSILGVELPNANTIELRSFFRFESIRASRSSKKQKITVRHTEAAEVIKNRITSHPLA
jgi:hypothetical protein